MAYSPAAMRTVGRACLIIYDTPGNELTIKEIVYGKPMTEENKELVLAWIYTQRPELKPQDPPPETPEEPETPEPPAEDPAEA